MTSEDEAWKLTERETVTDVVERVKQFVLWLVRRPETNVAVVSHGVWIECCFHFLCPATLKDGDRVRNADLFVGECISQNGVFHRLEGVRRIE